MRRRRHFHTATFRLAGLYLLLFALSAGLLAALLYFQVRTALQNEARTQIANEVRLLLYEYREDGIDELLEETEERIEKSPSPDRLLYMVQNPAGRVIFDRVATAEPPYGWRQVAGAQPTLFFFEPLVNGYVLGVGKEMAALAAIERAMRRALLSAAFAVLLLGLAGGIFLSRRTLAQLEAINRTAQAIGAGQLAQRIPLRDTGDELDELGRTLNGMFDRIETLVANVRQVSTGIAHDLRTPLARLRNRLELLQGSRTAIKPEDLAGAVAEVDDILQTFAALLRLAELETGQLKAGFSRVDMAALVQQMVAAYQPVAEDDDKSLATGTVATAVVTGDRDLLQQLLANLLENALQHGGAGCAVVVTLTSDGEDIVLAVADNGPGIPAAERERLLKPFQRLDGSGGTGLGLALVAAIAQLHDGRIELLDNQPGMLCRVRLPADDCL